MPHFDYYFIDLDGTMYQGNEAFPSGRRFIQRLQAADCKYLFVTNNSTKTPATVAQNLTENHDIPTLPEQIYTSAQATADYLASQGIQKVLVIGELGLTTAILEKGLELVYDETAQAVVVGLDRQINYEKLVQATLAIQNGALFIATNIDTNLPNERGMLPGAGTIVAAVQTATQTEPLVIGKPSHVMMTQALEKVGAHTNQVVMVGDNYQTDILAGIHAKTATLLVYSGVSKPSDLKQVTQQPTYTVENLDDWQIN